MNSHSLANLTRSADILVGCVLAVCPFATTSAQAVVPNTPVVAARSSDTQPDAPTVRDRWDASKAEAVTPTANRGAATTARAAPAGSREFAQQYVTEKIALWQQRLKLSDWRITWAMAHRSDLKPNTVGQIHWDKPSKSAAILVLDPSDYRMPFNAMLDEVEMTIIHELVHLKLTSLPHSEASRGSEEQAVNGLSEALFALEHQKQ